MFSILFSEPVNLHTTEPDCFRDLNLDQFLAPVLKNEKQICLAPYFYTPLPTQTQAGYRQEIQKDLLKKENLKLLDGFSREICGLAGEEEKANQDLHSEDPGRCHYLLYGHILDYGERYVRCLSELWRRIPDMELRSSGLIQAGQMLEAYVHSPFFRNLSAAQKSLREKFNGIHYLMQIRYGTVRVKKYEEEENLSEKITQLFRKFQGDRQHEYRQNLKQEPYADHVETAVLECLSRLYPGEFKALEAYVKDFSRFMNRELLQFCREIRFYIDWLMAVEPLQRCGLPFCFPEFSDSRFHADDIFDLVLADRIGNRVVKNDFVLEPKERFLVITGVNQGGKTTFARGLGQIHYLASLGLLIPGRSAVLRLTDQVLTHFEREESQRQGSGKLKDDLERLHGLLLRSTDRSFLVINEIFSSTSAKDAEKLGKQMLAQMVCRSCLGVLVTFLTELSSCLPEIVSMVSSGEPEHPELRTFRIVRSPPDQITCAMALARKHRLTYDQIMRRIEK